MRISRQILAVVGIVLILSLSGCGKTWAVTFTTTTDLDTWAKQDWFTPYTLQLFADGMYLDGKICIGPYGFSGNFTETITFNLDTMVANTVPMIEFTLSDGLLAPVSDFVQAIFNHVGDIGIETYGFYETGATMNSGTEIPSLNRDGSNTFKLVKTGDNIKMYMNDTILCDYDLVGCTLTNFYPYLNVNAADSSQIRITGISFKYRGNMIPRL